MKRSTSLLFAVVLCFSLSACGNKTDNSTLNNKTEQVSISQNNNSEDFVIGEELVCGNKLPFDFPLYKSKNIVSTIDSIKISKHKKCNINNIEDYVFVGANPNPIENIKIGDDDEILLPNHKERNNTYGVGYIFYKYHYKITVRGKTDKSLSGAVIYLYTDIDERLTIPSKVIDCFEFGYASTSTQLGFRVKDDGSFSGEYIVYSNENLKQFNVIGFTRDKAYMLNS